MSLKTNAGKDTSAAVEDAGSWETIKIVLQALAIAMVIRVFFYQPFNIPSGSMKETLLIGDYLFVSKLSYGYSKYSFPRFLSLCVPFTEACGTFRILPDMMSEGRVAAEEPKRGDVVVFRLPRDDSIDYIKRVIGMPGDEIQMKGGVLHINGQAIPKKPSGSFVIRDEETDSQAKVPAFEETLPNGVTYTVLDSRPNGYLDNTGVYKVPAGHFFMMGDNRDNSTDSRVARESREGGVGYVPFENLIGRAEVIFFSIDDGGCGQQWTDGRIGMLGWAGCLVTSSSIRWSRFFNLVR